MILPYHLKNPLLPVNQKQHYKQKISEYQGGRLEGIYLIPAVDLKVKHALSYFFKSQK